MQSFELPDFYVPWPARQNPNLSTARIHTKIWAQEVGILDTSQDQDNPSIWSEDDFDRHDYALFCAYIHPEVPSPELNLMADWNVWAFYVDDYFFQVYKQSQDHVGAKQYLDRILVFMPIDLSPMSAPTNPMECALADLWLRTAPTKSVAWRGRIIESTKNLLQAFLWELDNMVQQRLANPIEYIEMRRQVGAALWSADLVEHAMFIEIPDRIATARPMQVLKNTFADAVHLRNDIFSYQREVIKQGELTNAVLVLERFLNVDTQRAVNLVNNLLTSRLQQFEHTVITELAGLFAEYFLDPLEQAQVLNYIRGLQDWQSGAHEWHIQTTRYLNPKSEQSSAAGSPFNYGSAGFGMTALRITPDRLGLNRFKSYMHNPYQKVGPTRLPETFYMPFVIEVNPHLQPARQYSKEWAQQMGIVAAKCSTQPSVFTWDERRFDVINLISFNAMAHPDATAAQFNLDACWMVWATYSDDYFADTFGYTCDIANAKLFCARLSEFMTLNCVPSETVPLTPVERGLADLWSRTTTALSDDIRLSLRKEIDGMMASWVWELSNRIQNRIPDPVDYIEMRRKTSGSDYFLLLSRSIQGGDIPTEVYDTRLMKELMNAAIDHVCLINDLVSYQKEIEFEGDLHNMVLVLQNFLSCDKSTAVETVNNLMTARVKQFEHILMSDLPALCDDLNIDDNVCEQLIAYGKGLQHFMSASLRWHTTTGRYDEFEIRRSANPFTGGPTGFGTAAAHIPKWVNDDTNIQTASSSTQAQEVPKRISTFAVSHLNPSFMTKKEEA